MRILTIVLMVAAALAIPVSIPAGSRKADGRASAVAGVVKGQVELIGTKLKPRNGPPNSLVDAGGVVVWLGSLDGTPLRGGAKVRRTINQRDKRFSPHVVALEAGSQVEFPNDDPFFHNVFSIFNGRKFDLGLYASGETRPVNFNRPGISHIFCNIHPQMSAVVLALDSPYFAVTDSTGSLAIPGVPEGGYRLNVWHERTKPERLEELKRTMQVTAAGADLGVLRISEEGYLPRPHSNKHGQEYDKEQNRPGYRKP